MPAAHKFHTCSLKSIFSDAHVAGENDRTFFRRPAAKLCEAFRETEAGGAPKRTARKYKPNISSSARDDRLRNILERVQVEHVDLIRTDDIEVVADIEAAVIPVPLRDGDLLAQREAVIRRIAIDEIAVFRREGDDVLAAVDQNGLVVVQRLAVVSVNGLRVQIVQLRGIGRVDHDELHTVYGRAIDRLRLHAETEKQPVRPDMQIVRIAAELELADNLRVRRVGQVDRKDRIRLAVGAQIAVIPVKARGEHRLPFRKSGHAADGVQVTVEYVDIVARLR